MNKTHHKVKRITLIFFVYLLLSFIFSRTIITSPGIIGLRDDWYILPFPEQHQYATTRFLYSWFGGSMFFRNLGEIPNIITGYLSHTFSISGEAYSKMYVLLMPAIAGTTFYNAARRFKLRNYPAFLGGIVYITSPFFFNSIVSGYVLFLLGLAVLPQILKLYADYLEKKFSIRRLFSLGVLIRLGVSQDNMLYVISILLASYFIYFNIVAHKHKFIKTLLHTIILGILICLFTLHFLVLIPLNLHASINFVTSGLDVWITKLSPQAFPAIFQDGGGYQYYLSAFKDIHPTLWIIVLGLFTSISSLALSYSTKNKYIPYFFFLILIGILGFKGTNEPFGSLNRFLYEETPLIMGAFRNTQYLSIFSSIGFAFAFASTTNYVRYKKNKLVILLITLLVLFRALPFFTGNYFNNVQNIVLSKDLNQLDYDLRSTNDEFTVLLLPPIIPVSYHNSKFAGLDLMAHGQPHRFIGITGDTDYQRQLIEQLYILDNHSFFSWFLKIYNTRYVAYRGGLRSETITFMDLNYRKYIPIWTNERLEENILSLAGIKLFKSYSSETSLYTYSDPLPIIYSPSTIKLLENDPLKPTTYQSNVSSEEPTVVFTQQNDRQIIDTLAQNNFDSPIIRYQKINPTEYSVDLKASTKPFVIVLSENYDNLWDLYAEDRVTSLSFPQFKINGYANAWIIDPDQYCQQFSCNAYNEDENIKIYISYTPQRIYHPAMIISYISFFISLSYLLISGLTNFRHVV